MTASMTHHACRHPTVLVAPLHVVILAVVSQDPCWTWMLGQAQHDGVYAVLVVPPMPSSWRSSARIHVDMDAGSSPA